MGKTGRWIRSFLTGKKDKEKDKDKGNSSSNNNSKNNNQPSTLLPSESKSAPLAIPVPPTTPKEKRRWSFRRSKEVSTTEHIGSVEIKAAVVGAEDEQKKHAMAVAAATAAAADAAVAAVQVATAVMRLTAATAKRTSAIEEAAATKIQSVFRSYLARKALCALKGLVKLQALVRGHLVRKQATATLRCMQALVTVQERARAQRIRMVEAQEPSPQRQSVHRRSPQDPRFRHSYEMDRNVDENIKIVEMDLGESKGSSRSRNSYSIQQPERSDHRISTYYSGSRAHAKIDHLSQQVSPAPSALTDMSPRGGSAHFEDFSFTTAQSSPQYLSAMSKLPTRTPFSQAEYAYSMSNDYPFFPNYMANTESSRAKARSQSAPKQRPDSCERPPSRRRPSIEGRNNIPRGVRMQRSSSHVGSAVNGYQYPWSIKLDRSTVSLKESECGSTSTVLTNTYCRSLAAYESHVSRH
ncbi:hypothetical protein QJS04_geneDACA007514 [Acorus gramineus]|uniref:DUF4005 domain-containing protein n=1 Tax=Acorus gramineus TaxID=55184 RepID=A0AAV9B6X7_ACOGR|nr:hypothetical protein QJS04_geneDACA007514 [Acorus gramineus]